MKYFLITSGSLLVILLLIVLFQNPVPSETQVVIPISDEVIKTTEKSEKVVFCNPQPNTHEVYHVNRIWVVDEYKSGKIVTNERQDTLMIEPLPKGHPCPGELVEVTMR